MKHAHVVKNTPKKSLVVAIQMPVNVQTVAYVAIAARTWIVANYKRGH